MNKDGKIGKIDTSSILKSFYPTAKGDIFKVYPYLMNFHASNSGGHSNLYFDKLNVFCHAIFYEYQLFLPILTYKIYVYDTLG